MHGVVGYFLMSLLQKNLEFRSTSNRNNSEVIKINMLLYLNFKIILPVHYQNTYFHTYHKLILALHFKGNFFNCFKNHNTLFFGILKSVFVGVQLLYNIVLVSPVQQNESAIHIHISAPIWTSYSGRHRALSRVPCAIQQVPIS